MLKQAVLPWFFWASLHATGWRCMPRTGAIQIRSFVLTSVPAWSIRPEEHAIFPMLRSAALAMKTRPWILRGKKISDFEQNATHHITFAFGRTTISRLMLFIWRPCERIINSTLFHANLFRFERKRAILSSRMRFVTVCERQVNNCILEEYTCWKLRLF
jgi:hypothetical protein